KPLRGTLSAGPYLSSALPIGPAALLTSLGVTLPPGPVPRIASIFIPSSLATARAAGVASNSSSSGRTPTTETDFGFSSSVGFISGTSPSSAIVTRTSPTFAVSPSVLFILTTRPAFGDGTSTIALSVSISRTFWCSSTRSPSLTSHFLISPSVIPSPKSGNLKSNGIVVFSFEVSSKKYAVSSKKSQIAFDLLVATAYFLLPTDF